MFPQQEDWRYFGKSLFDSIEKYCKVGCGYSAIDDVETKSHMNRMDSFFLAGIFLNCSIISFSAIVLFELSCVLFICLQNIIYYYLIIFYFII